MRKPSRAFGLAVLLCGTGCVAPGSAPVVDSSRSRDAAPAPPAHSPAIPSPPLEKATPAAPPSHLVRYGDTLYAIAWRYALDYRDIAAWNRLRPPYVIYEDQQLRLRPLRRTVTPSPPVRARQSAKVEKRTVPAPPLRRPAVRTGPIHWGWPAKGKLLKIKSLTARSGLSIGGRLGQRVQASADGEVVYSGSGLLGYGKLIIIKHSEKFLSAYGHNSELLVKEGDQVRSGQQIAKMGKAVNGDVMLHFEIRKEGRPINPLKYLPKAST